MTASSPSERTRRVSVIIPCFDAADTLPGCLEGLLAQRFADADVELFVVDNNSRDDTEAIARGHSRVTLLRESTQGAYAARNTGVAAAQGEILAFIDPDCIPQPDWLQQLTEPFASPDVKITVGRSRLAGRSLAMQTFGDYEHVKDGIVLGGRDPELYYGHTNNMGVRRELFDLAGIPSKRKWRCTGETRENDR